MKKNLTKNLWAVIFIAVFVLTLLPVFGLAERYLSAELAIVVALFASVIVAGFVTVMAGRANAL